jgi:hypothetical protein
MDIGGWSGSDRVNFILDTIEPDVSPGEVEIEGNVVIIDWSSEGIFEGIEITAVMDGSDILAEHDLENGISTFREVPPGEHKINLTFTDKAGNSKILSFDVDILRSTGKNSEKGGINPIIILISLVLILIITATVIILIVRRPKDGEKGREERLQSPNKPQKITFGHMPAVQNASSHPRHHARPSPAPVSNAHSENVEDSYIRPEKRKTPVRKTKNPPGPVSSKRENEEEIIEDEIEDWSDMEELEEFEELEEI